MDVKSQNITREYSYKSREIPLRILFCGMLGPFSARVLQTLLSAHCHICAVLLPAPTANRSENANDIWCLQSPQTDKERQDGNGLGMLNLPLLNNYMEQNIVNLAWTHEIPVYEVRNLNRAESLNQLEQLAFDVACVACFSKRFPNALLALPKHGFLNVHPSLLPLYRGPNPIFEILRDGAYHAAGVTIHWMDEGLDTGDIAIQMPLTFPDNISVAKAEAICAEQGGQLLVQVLTAIQNGTQTRTPQSTLERIDPSTEN